MKEKKNLKIVIIKAVSSIHLVNWMLLIFMLILLIQITYNLFYNELNGNTSGIDTALRTTTASLFGYFIGKGFATDKKKPSESMENKANLIDKKQNILTSHANAQVLIVGTIGLVSLIILIITRNMNIVTVEKIATISQLRDFISGSTGFLISQSNTNN